MDTPSFSYSFSFEQKPDWSRAFAPGRELKGYAEHCVDKYGLRSRIRLSTEVAGARFDDDAHLWRLRLASGEELSARHVIMATGVLTKPRPPGIPGVDAFKGKLIHTARWDHGHSLRGRRVGIVGTGASALQVIPSIAPDVEHLVVFQRTPIWVLPKPDPELTPAIQALFRHVVPARLSARMLSHLGWELTAVAGLQYGQSVPGLVRLMEQVCRWHLRAQVPDPVLREKLTPRYGYGCKRPSLSNEYLRAFNRPNVTLETASIAEVTASGVRTAAGREHAVDTLILATGFKVFEKGNMPPFPICGVGGTDLEGWWDAERYQAFQGVSMPGFPNLFTIAGPYGYNGAAYFQLIEAQSRHILRCLRHARRRRATRVEVTRRANDEYFQAMLARRKNQVFFNGTCGSANSYYFDKHGDVPFLPALTPEMHWRAARFDLSSYAFTTLAANPARTSESKVQ